VRNIAPNTVKGTMATATPIKAKGKNKAAAPMPTIFSSLFISASSSFRYLIHLSAAAALNFTVKNYHGIFAVVCNPIMT
jgi:hypothetical protein